MSKKEIQPSKFQKTTLAVLKDTAIHIVQGITGIAASKREDLVLSVGYIFQRLIAGQFLSTLTKEWDQYKKKGRIKHDYEQTGQHKACLQELLDALDKDLPDEERFSVLKQIFLVAATEEISDRNSHLPLQFMQIARTLSTGEILVLSAEYKLVGRDERPWRKDKYPSAEKWLKEIAAESGLKYPELVAIHENKLMKKSLFTDRELGNGSGVVIREYDRLTQLGYDFCNYMGHYEG